MYQWLYKEDPKQRMATRHGATCFAFHTPGVLVACSDAEILDRLPATSGDFSIAGKRRNVPHPAIQIYRLRLGSLENVGAIVASPESEGMGTER